MQQGRPVRQPERHPRRLLAQHEDAELRAEPAVIARLRLLDPLEVSLEILGREERGPVDPGQHLPGLVAPPIGAGDRVQLDRLDPPGRGPVRAPAEVLERPVAVERDGLDAFVRDEVLDQLDLVALALVAEDLDRLGNRHVAARELLVGGDVGAHRLLDRLQVGVGDPDVLGELEVVVEAVLDRRADRHLGPRVELLDRLGHDVGGVVADQRQRVVVAIGEDRDLAAVAQRRREVAELAVDGDRQRRLRQAGPDRGGGVGAGGAIGELERCAVGQFDGDRGRGTRHARHATRAPRVVVSLTAPGGPGAPRSRGSRRLRRPGRS